MKVGMNARQINHRAVDYLRQIAERKSQLVADGDDEATTIRSEVVLLEDSEFIKIFNST